MSGRDIDIKDSEAVIGPVINTLPVVFRFEPEADLATQLLKTLQNIGNVSQYQWSTAQQINHHVTTLLVNYDNKRGMMPHLGFDSIDSSGFSLSVLVGLDGSFRSVFDPNIYSHDSVDQISHYFHNML